MRIGLILPNWIGDVVMATPTVRAIRKHFAEAALIGVMRPYVAPLLEGLPWLDERLTYDSRGQGATRSMIKLVRNLRRRKLDCIVLLTNSLRTGLMGWLSGAKRRVGYVRYGRGPLLTGGLEPPRQGRRLTPFSAVDYYLELAYELGCPTESHKVQLATTPEEERAADQVWETRGLNHSRCVVTLNSGGAYGAAKHWPPEYFAGLATGLVRRADTSVLVLCGPTEREAAQQIERLAAHPRVTSLAGEQPSLGLSKACVRRSQMLITTDSGPRHFAAAFDVPALTLFGPTDPRWSHNYHHGENVVHLTLPCVPCSRRVCPYGHHRCMRDLTPDQIICLAQRQLGADERAA